MFSTLKQLLKQVSDGRRALPGPRESSVAPAGGDARPAAAAQEAGARGQEEEEEGARALRFADNAPSWEDLQQQVEAKQRALGAVPPDPEADLLANSAALRRTFGQPGEPRILLYRDHAAWCPYW